MKTRAARLEVRNLTVLSAARAILTASDVPSCRAAIGRAATGLGQETGCPVRACEISVSLHGVISIAWQGGDSQGPPFDDQGGFGVWFVRALSQLGKLTAIYGSAAGLVARKLAGDTASTHCMTENRRRRRSGSGTWAASTICCMARLESRYACAVSK